METINISQIPYTNIGTTITSATTIVGGFTEYIMIYRQNDIVVLQKGGEVHSYKPGDPAFIEKLCALLGIEMPVLKLPKAESDIVDLGDVR